MQPPRPIQDRIEQTRRAHLQLQLLPLKTRKIRRLPQALTATSSDCTAYRDRWGLTVLPHVHHQQAIVCDTCPKTMTNVR